MDALPKPCPSCGGACGRTKRSGCKYVGGETEADRLRRELRDARMLIAGALHLSWGKSDMTEWATKAMRWQEGQTRHLPPNAAVKPRRCAVVNV